MFKEIDVWESEWVTKQSELDRRKCIVMKKLVLLYSVLLMTGCSQITVLDPKSVTGKEQAYLIWLSIAIMSIVILVVFALFTRFVIKYRYTKERHDVVPKDVKGHKMLELTYTVIPILLLVILAVPTVKITMDQSPSTEAAEDENATHITVKAKQFEWAFEHENGKKVVDELIIPENETVTFHLWSEDVIHSFWIPELAGKVDVMPDKELTYTIRDAVKGKYQGKCAEFCGIQHTNMTFTVNVVTVEEYEDYLNNKAD